MIESSIKSEATRIVQWGPYLLDIDLLAKAIIKSGVKFDEIAALIRGGLIPGTILSHKLGVSVTPFDPNWANPGAPSPVRTPGDPRPIILIVDDISDSGETFKKCVDYFSKIGWDCMTMSVFVNMSQTSFVPDFYRHDSNGEYIVFPYELEGRK